VNIFAVTPEAFPHGFACAECSHEPDRYEPVKFTDECDLPLCPTCAQRHEEDDHA